MKFEDKIHKSWCTSRKVLDPILYLPYTSDFPNISDTILGIFTGDKAINSKDDDF